MTWIRTGGWKRMEERLESIEERVTRGADDGGVSMLRVAAAMPAANERALKENLRKFVAPKVFPN